MSYLKLIDPFDHDYPKKKGEVIEDRFAVCCKFNRRGSMLAVGTNEGQTLIYDFETKGIARILDGHIHPVRALSWSRNSRKILTAAGESSSVLLLWALKEGVILIRLRYPVPITSASLHPRDPRNCIVCFDWNRASERTSREPEIIDLNTKHLTTMLLQEDDSVPFSNIANPVSKKIIISCPQVAYRRPWKKGGKGRRPTQPKKDVNVIADWIAKGKQIIAGSSRGTITCYDFYPSLKIKKTKKVSNNAQIKSICESPCGNYLITNSSDRILRVLNMSTFASLQAFQDRVEKTQWNKCTIDYSGEYILADSGKSHNMLNIYERHSGQLIKILEDNQGSIVDLQPHPTRAIAVSCTSTGALVIWEKEIREKWKAFDSDFVELEGNVYATPEDEAELESKLLNKKEEQKICREPMDITTIDNVPLEVSEDEEEPPWDPMDSLASEFINFPLEPIDDSINHG